MSELRGDLHARGRRFAIAVARFNELVTRELLQGALAGLHAHGVAEEDVDVVWVPGAFELPLVARRLAGSRTFDAVICLGAVIRGDTPHFDYVAGECAAGVARVSLETGIPCIFGVLTVDDLDQAMARTGGTEGNKGIEAAHTAVEMIDLLRNLPRAVQPRRGK